MLKVISIIDLVYKYLFLKHAITIKVLIKDYFYSINISFFIIPYIKDLVIELKYEVTI